MASLGPVAQDLVQVPCIRGKQGVRPCPLVTESFIQVLHLQHQVKAALPALPQTPLREAPAKGLGLLEHFLAWLPHFIFHHFPLLQEDPDFRLNPWAIRRTCKGQRDGMKISKVTHTTTSTFLGDSCCTLLGQKGLQSVIKWL